MMIDVDSDAFLRRRRIIELRQVLPDIDVALREAIKPETRAYLQDSKSVFERELAELLKQEAEQKSQE